MTQSLPGQRPAQEQAFTGHGRPPVVVIGAGPYGLSVAAHLRAAGAPVRVFGDVMGSWRHAMATGMYLKSTPDATDLSAPEPGGTLADFRRVHSEPELTELTPIPCDVFVRYGQWFQKRYVGEVEPARVTAVERAASGPGFVVRLDDGSAMAASAVVVATGLNGLAHVPDELRRLAPEGPGPRARVSHTSHHTDLSVYAGRRVAVIGGGQSALESAALLHEAGAEAQVLVRERTVLWGMEPELSRPWTQRVTKPASPLGTGWILAGVCASPGAVRRLPAAARLLLFRRALGPSGGWWLRDRVEGVVPVRTSRRVTGAVVRGPEVRLDVVGPGGERESLAVDHVLAATGYRLDLDALPFLSPAVRDAVACVPGSKAPALRGTFESSVPGLYFTGSLAAPMFGPMMRFVAGTEFAAVRIARHVAAA
ncbi:FAD-dependent oxidoreductase [Streptomyces sp. Ag109_O5-10]|uniref:FAD-dependent oxidoreductase n=1 Tax=Streptomyces sp. Ag109_O5-10 TaxID=1855349 RepID=UPI00089799EA|nr:FAD-dependent oxidoreductase [Streptomyces sp. Ag109_O5-10]SED72089.1 Predicted flavoprotein CzcO associated with the cation diffusion facilitator CzcD [Streptomyces sp. Ag109_O5-10]